MLVDLVRQKLTKQQKVTINALIVLDVHAKDVVSDFLTAKTMTFFQKFDYLLIFHFF